MAVKEVERKHATLEAFALHVFAHPQRSQLMSPATAYQKKAEILGLSTQATVYLLAMSKRFQRLMKELSIAQHWNFEAQDAANKQFVEDLKNPIEKPGERVKVATYLNKELGIGAEEDQKGGVVINLSFGGDSLAKLSQKLQVDSSDDDNETRVLDPHGNPVTVHRPALAGESDPAGVRVFTQRAPLSADALLGPAAPRPRVGETLTRNTGDADAATGVAESATDGDNPADVYPRY